MEFKVGSVFLQSPFLCFLLSLLWLFVFLSLSLPPHTRTRTCVYTQKEDRKETRQSVSGGSLWMAEEVIFIFLKCLFTYPQCSRASLYSEKPTQ